MSKATYSFFPEDFVYNVYKLNHATETFELLVKLKYKDIISSSIELDYVGEDVMTLQIKEYSMATVLRDDDNLTTLMYERLVYDNISEGTEADSEYNPIFFGVSWSATIVQESNIIKETYTIKGVGFKSFIESRKIVQHTTVHNTIVLDANGNLPYNFNKFQMPTTNGIGCDGTVKELLVWLYTYTIKSPRPLKKAVNVNTIPVSTLRLIKGFNDFKIQTPTLNPDPKYSCMLDKRSMTEILSDAWDFYENASDMKGYYIHYPFVKIINGKFDVVLIKSKALLLDNFEVDDEPIGYDTLEDESSHVNSVLTESDQNDLAYAFVTVEDNLGDNPDITTFEEISSSNSETENVDDSILQNNCLRIIEDNRIVTNVGIDIEFKNHIFLKDFTINDRLQLVNYSPDLLNQSFHIKKITEIIEENYVTYAITDSQDTIIDWSKE